MLQQTCCSATRAPKYSKLLVGGITSSFVQSMLSNPQYCRCKGFEFRSRRMASYRVYYYLQYRRVF